MGSRPPVAWRPWPHLRGKLPDATRLHTRFLACAQRAALLASARLGSARLDHAARLDHVVRLDARSPAASHTSRDGPKAFGGGDRASTPRPGVASQDRSRLRPRTGLLGALAPSGAGCPGATRGLGRTKGRAQSCSPPRLRLHLCLHVRLHLHLRLQISRGTVALSTSQLVCTTPAHPGEASHGGRGERHGDSRHGDSHHGYSQHARGREWQRYRGPQEECLSA